MKKTPCFFWCDNFTPSNQHLKQKPFFGGLLETIRWISVIFRRTPLNLIILMIWRACLSRDTLLKYRSRSLRSAPKRSDLFFTVNLVEFNFTACCKLMLTFQPKKHRCTVWRAGRWTTRSTRSASVLIWVVFLIDLLIMKFVSNVVALAVRRERKRASRLPSVSSTSLAARPAKLDIDEFFQNAKSASSRRRFGMIWGAFFRWNVSFELQQVTKLNSFRLTVKNRSERFGALQGLRDLYFRSISRGRRAH